jgi:hypothetical protein
MVHGHAQYVHDVRLPLVPVIQYGYRSQTPSAKAASQAADVASKVVPVGLKQEVANV